METEETDLLIVTEEEQGERLDKILSLRFKDMYSRTYFQYLIEHQLVLLNGQPVKKRIQPQVGDEIEIQFATTPETELRSENIPLNILYEDDDLLVINKPAGMVVHPAPGHWSQTFVNALLHHCQHLPNPHHSLRPGIVHRLDKETSGVLIAAKTLEMQQKLVTLFASRQVYKEYWAICLGKPKSAEAHFPIGRHPIHRKQMAIVSTGKPALSYFEVLGYHDHLSFVKAIIATGRTHQIRVHLKHLGSPVIGDTLYGSASANATYKVKRQLLHAAKLRFIHPLTQEELTFVAPLPPDMEQIAKTLLSEKTLSSLLTSNSERQNQP